MSAYVSIKYRPLRAWTDPVSDPQPSPFTAKWSDTQVLLRREVDVLSDLLYPEVVIELDVPASSIRADGELRGDRRVQSRRVVVSFDSRHGPLRYACDTYISHAYRETLTDWQHNVRAIALGLEALRKVSRYGIGQRGEQYTGWAQLRSGIPIGTGRAEWTAERAMGVLGFRVEPSSRAVIEQARRALARLHHPDAGGDGVKMQEINAAADFLLTTV